MGVLSKSPAARTPALLIQTSTFPLQSLAVWARLSIAFGSVTSVMTTNAWAPSALHSSATSCSAASFLPASTTMALYFANSRAVARPAPLDAPVMTTVLSFKELSFITGDFLHDCNNYTRSFHEANLDLCKYLISGL